MKVTKAVDYLGKSPTSTPQASVLFGDDSLLKVWVTETFLRSSGIDRENLERFEVRSSGEIEKAILGGSLLGRRFLAFDLSGTSLKATSLDSAVAEAKENGDIVVIRVEKRPEGKTGAFVLVDCTQSRNSGTRRRIAESRMDRYGIRLEPKALQVLLTGTETTAELDAALRSLSYTANSEKAVTVRDIQTVISHSPECNITLALLHGDLNGLRRAVAEHPGPYVLVVLFNTFSKLYFYREMLAAGSPKDESGEQLKIPRRQRIHWRMAFQKYSEPTLRRLISITANAYDKAVHGHQDWREPLLLELTQILLGRHACPEVQF